MTKFRGTRGRDDITGTSGNDVMFLSAGDDFGEGGGGKDRIEGEDGNDILRGNSGDDRLAGGTGNDIMYGGDGNDIITGGIGGDLLFGGRGADRFVFTIQNDSDPNFGNGGDTIVDFSRSEHDKIDLSAIDAHPSARGNQAFTFIGMDDYSGKEGEVHYFQFVNDASETNTAIGIDINGDMVTDMVIVIEEQLNLVQADFIL